MPALRLAESQVWDRYDGDHRTRVVIPIPAKLDGRGNGLPLAHSAREMWVRIPDLHILIGQHRNERGEAQAAVLKPRIAVLPVEYHWTTGIDEELIDKSLTRLLGLPEAARLLGHRLCFMPRFGEDKTGDDWHYRIRPIFEEHFSRAGLTLKISTTLEVRKPVAEWNSRSIRKVLSSLEK